MCFAGPQDKGENTSVASSYADAKRLDGRKACRICSLGRGAGTALRELGCGLSRVSRLVGFKNLRREFSRASLVT